MANRTLVVHSEGQRRRRVVLGVLIACLVLLVAASVLNLPAWLVTVLNLLIVSAGITRALVDAHRDAPHDAPHRSTSRR